MIQKHKHLQNEKHACAVVTPEAQEWKSHPNRIRQLKDQAGTHHVRQIDVGRILYGVDATWIDFDGNEAAEGESSAQHHGTDCQA